jgi:CheY-like chemotaxis protein
MYFPAHPDGADAAVTRPDPTPDQTGGGTGLPKLHSHVLVVDDDDLLRVQTRQSLILLGCRVTEAASAAQALEVLATTPAIDLVLSDIVMRGGMDGKQLAARIRALYPALPILLTTGYSKGLTDDPDLPPILYKPYRLQDLKQRLSGAMRSRNGGGQGV